MKSSLNIQLKKTIEKKNKKVEKVVIEVLKKGMENEIEQGMENEIEQGMEDEIEEGMEEGMENEIEQGMEDEIERGMEDEMKQKIPPKIAKLQLFAFWFIYSLHNQRILSPDIIIHILPLINNSQFISSFFSSTSIKKKYYAFLDNNKFPFIRQYYHFLPTLHPQHYLSH